MGKSKCKGPEAGKSFIGSEYRRKAIVAGICAEGESDTERAGKGGRGQTTKGLGGAMSTESGFSPDCTGDSDCKQENIVRPVLLEIAGALV